MNVEKFLDDCYLAGISPVSIIHGKGTGILRKGLQGYMKNTDTSNRSETADTARAKTV